MSPEVQKAWILHGLNLGVPLEQVAADLGTEMGEVQKVAIEAGIIADNFTRNADIAKMLAEGVRPADAAEKYGISTSLVNKVAREHGLFRSRHRYWRRNRQRNEKIIAAVRAGQSQSSVARQFGLQSTYVSRLMRSPQ